MYRAGFSTLARRGSIRGQRFDIWWLILPVAPEVPSHQRTGVNRARITRRIDASWVWVRSPGIVTLPRCVDSRTRWRWSRVGREGSGRPRACASPKKGRRSSSATSTATPHAGSPPGSTRPAVGRSTSRSTSRRRPRWPTSSTSPLSTYGGLDYLHCNAAALAPDIIGRDSDVETVPLDVFDRTMAVNLRGHFLCTRLAIPHLSERGGGAIVYTASAAAYIGEPERPSYAIAKSGITALARHVASRWGKEGIRANAIAPGLIMTPAVAAGTMAGHALGVGAEHPARVARGHRRGGRVPAVRRRRVDQRPGPERRRRRHDALTANRRQQT